MAQNSGSDGSDLLRTGTEHRSPFALGPPNVSGCTCRELLVHSHRLLRCRMQGWASSGHRCASSILLNFSTRFCYLNFTFDTVSDVRTPSNDFAHFLYTSSWHICVMACTYNQRSACESTSQGDFPEISGQKCLYFTLGRIGKARSARVPRTQFTP